MNIYLSSLWLYRSKCCIYLGNLKKTCIQNIILNKLNKKVQCKTYRQSREYNNTVSNAGLQQKYMLVQHG